MPRLFQALQSDRLPVEPVLGSFLRILWVESVVLLAVVVAAAVLSSTHLVGGS